jgi:hypothetical protein
VFREAITSADGTVTAGTCDEAHALSLLRRAVRRGYTVEATRAGGAVIVRTVHDGDYVPRRHTVTIEPAVPAGKITKAMRRDLVALADRDARSGPNRIDAGTRRINAGLYSIPPAATARLADRGLVKIDDDRVTVSLAARLAILAQDHRTETSEPRGYHRVDGVIGPWRKGGCLYDGSSVARCACHWTYPMDTRDSARRKAHEHRQQVTAALVGELTGETA